MIRIGLFFLLLNSAVAWSANLPAEHEIVRLMLAVEASVENSNWEKAAQQLSALEALKSTLPDDYLYFNGLVNAKLENFSLSEDNLESYIINVGKDAKHYIEALKLITTLEAHKENLRSHSVSESKASPVLTTEARTGYIKSLQALYLTDDPVKALILHVNSLLSVHAYTGLRVKKTKVRTGLVYSISVDKGLLGLQEKNYASGFPTLTATKLDVHGLDPFLKYECKKQKFSCVIYHPADQHLAWIMIENDALVARELVEALTKLIQYLQMH